MPAIQRVKRKVNQDIQECCTFQRLKKVTIFRIATQKTGKRDFVD
jgi:hypothetical protein